MLRESAELASLAAAERAGVPHVHVCIGMHEVVRQFAAAVAEPLEELGRLAGLADGQATAALAAETVFSLVPEALDDAAGEVPPRPRRTCASTSPLGERGADLPAWGDPDLPLVYVTLRLGHRVARPLRRLFREALDGLADIDARVLMTVGRRIDPADLAPWPANARVEQWCHRPTCSPMPRP